MMRFTALRVTTQKVEGTAEDETLALVMFEEGRGAVLSETVEITKIVRRPMPDKHTEVKFEVGIIIKHSDDADLDHQVEELVECLEDHLPDIEETSRKPY